MKKFLLRDHFDTARHSLKRTRLRTFLTTIGIAIGVACVTVILSLATGITSVITRQVDDMGGTVAVVRPGAKPSDSVDTLLNPTISQRFSTSTLSNEDVAELKKIDPSLHIAPLMTLMGAMKTPSSTVADGTVMATTPEFAKTTHLPIEEGQFIDSETTGKVAVLGQQLAIDLFGTNNPIGQTFEFRGQSITVIGVLNRLNTPINYNSVDFDQTAIIRFDLGGDLSKNHAQIQQINISAETAEGLQATLPKVESTMAKLHGEQDYQVVTGRDISRPASQFFQAVGATMAAIAAVSLIVGGIGIMNIMLVGVAERTREIGIRKSVGASNTMIVTQFLTESLLISLAGGLAGYVLGVMIAFLIGTFIYFAPIYTWEVALIALGISLLVGVLFGLYPALRAARKDPIESLRQYR